MNSKESNKYLFVLMFVLIVYLAYIIIKPFLIAIIISAVLAYIFYPLYEKLNNKIKKKNFSALIVSIFIIILIAIPTFFTVGAIAKESQVVYIRAKQVFVTGDIFSIGCSAEEHGVACSISNWMRDLIQNPSIRYNLEDSLRKTTGYITEVASDFVLSIPSIILNIFVTFFTLFYFFRDGDKLVRRIRHLLPVKKKYQKKIMREFDEASYGIIYGSLIVALMQGAVGAVGFFLFGVNSPIIWGIIMAIFALVPFLGTALVWVPFSAVLLVQGFGTDSQSLILKGIGLILYGALVISTIDNLAKPLIIGKKGKIHPVLVLVGVLGGILVFGFIGFIIGPLIIAISMTFLSIYENEKGLGGH